MKTLLIILNLAGGQPAIIDYPDAAACERAAEVFNKENRTVMLWAYASCIPAP